LPCRNGVQIIDSDEANAAVINASKPRDLGEAISLKSDASVTVTAWIERA
jgi:hypothetical protein